MLLTLIVTTVLLTLALIGFTFSKPEHKSYQLSLGVILIGGLLIYSYIYHQTESNALLVPLQAAWAVVKMFTGGQEYSRALQTELFQNPLMQLVFWLVHAFALYITASATVKLLGQSLIRQFKLFTERKKPVSLIFGLNQDSLSLAKQLEKDGTVVYFDKVSSEFSDKLKGDKTKSVIIGEVSESVLNKHYITPNRQKISAYALSEDYDANLAFASSLKKLKEHVHLTLMGDEEDYLREPAFNDFASVYVTNPLVLSARQLIQQSPPYKAMTFTDGRATTDFYLLQIGFGHIGQEVMKQIYMNAQFVGSQFRADIFAPDVETNTGRIKATTTFMADDCIHLHSSKGESSEFYDFLADAQSSSVNYIVIATGDSERNREFARHLRHQFGKVPIHIVQTDGVYKGAKFYPNFDKNLLDSAKLDEKAKLLNYEYYKWDKKYKENPSNKDAIWTSTNYLSRMSSRASADFSSALLKASGYEMDDTWKETVTADENLCTMLGQMEHLRWNAFYKTMGYQAMSEKTIRQKALGVNLDLLPERAAAKDKTKQKVFIDEITKDAMSRQHACLIDWEELPGLDDLVEELCFNYLGKFDGKTSYQDMDEGFVNMVPILHEKKED